MAKAWDDDLMIKYLLGEASEQEQSRLEEEYFADDALFEQLLAAEDDLIDSYVRGDLSSHEHKLFERSFLTSHRRRERVELARGLRRAISTELAAAGEHLLNEEQKSAVGEDKAMWWRSLLAALSGKNPTLGFALAALLFVVLGAASVLLLQQRHEDRRLASSPAVPQQKDVPPQLAAPDGAADQTPNNSKQETSPRNSPAQELTAKPQQPRVKEGANYHVPRHDDGAKQLSPRPIIASFVLAPGLSRDINEASNLAVPPGTDRLRLQLNFVDDNYSAYRAVLETAEGKKIWSQSALKSRSGDSGNAVVLTLPADLLKDGDYILTLGGVTPRQEIEDVSEYSFRIVRK
jgi:hypothetical protein